MCFSIQYLFQHILFLAYNLYIYTYFFNLENFFFIQNDKPKNTNSAVIHKQALYHNTTISLV